LMRDAIAVHEASLTGLFVDDHDYPTPLMPSNVKEELGFLDVPPLEMARQLCVQHHELFQSITMADLLNPARNRSDAAQPPSIAKLIAKFNRFSFGLAGEVVSTGNIDMRVTVVERVIFLGEHLRALGNFHGVMAVVSALNLGCVQRLKQTWQRVRKARLEVFNQLSELMASKNNFAAYRRAIGDAQPPVVPFVGVLMNDLVAIEELPERLANDASALNWGKLSSFAGVLRPVKKQQAVPYRFERVPTVSEYLDHMPVLPDAELHRLSKLIEQTSVRDAPGSAKRRWWHSNNK
jgi:son of sevenless-like protein